MSTQIRRFGHIPFQRERRWVEITDGQYFLLEPGSPQFEDATSVRELAREEVDQLTYLAPFFGEKVLGLAYNYKSLVGEKAEHDEPLFFLKSPTSPCGPNSEIEYPWFASEVWVEVELTVLMGRECRNVSPEEAGDYILGYTVGSDVTARNIHGRDHHLARSKALDSFAPMGPCVVTGIGAGDLSMTTLINGEVYQSGSTSDMILNPCECVSLLSRYVTLKRGDAIMTGTPAGAMSSLVEPGDKVRQEIENIGVLEYGFVARSRTDSSETSREATISGGNVE